MPKVERTYKVTATALSGQIVTDKHGERLRSE